MKDEKGVTLGKVTGMEHFRKKKTEISLIDDVKVVRLLVGG